MEILKHKDMIDELVASGDEIMKTCTEEEKLAMKVQSPDFLSNVSLIYDFFVVLQKTLKYA